MVNNFTISVSFTHIYILRSTFEWITCQSHVELWPDVLLCRAVPGDTSLSETKQLLSFFVGSKLWKLIASLSSGIVKVFSSLLLLDLEPSGICGLKLMLCGLLKAKHMLSWLGRDRCHAFPKMSNKNWNIHANNIYTTTISRCYLFWLFSVSVSKTSSTPLPRDFCVTGR